MFRQDDDGRSLLRSGSKWLARLTTKAEDRYSKDSYGLVTIGSAVVVVVILLLVVLVVTYRRRRDPTKGEGGSAAAEQLSSKNDTTSTGAAPFDGGESGDGISSAPTTAKLSLTRSAHTISPSNGSSSHALCPSLVVEPRTRGACERTYILREHTFSFRPRNASVIRDAVDKSEVATVDGACIGVGDRIALRSADKRDLLCEIQKSGEVDRIVFNIYSSHQIFYGSLEKDPMGEAPTFTAKNADGRTLLVFAGNFADKDFKVTMGTSTADVVAQAGHNFQPCEDCSHYQVRVAPGADTGLILACCMVIDEDIAL